MSSGRFDALALLGPTASGKTALSLEIARRLDVEIISMDSRQLYRGMDIGTAKVTADERAAVPHHGVDLVHPGERFSAGEFARRARQWIAAIGERGRTPLLVGGTGFFLRALTDPIFRQPELDPRRRDALRAALERLATAELLRWLERLDPPTAARLRRAGGRQRLLRSLELPLLTGRPLSWWHQHAPPEAPRVCTRVFVLDLPRDELLSRIDRRVDAMVEAGLVEEVRRLVAEGYGEGSPGLRAHGYQELLPYLRGEVSLERALEHVRRATRAYAKRQLTWFRHQLPDGAVWLDAARPAAELAEEIVQRWSEPRPPRRPGGREEMQTRSQEK